MRFFGTKNASIIEFAQSVAQELKIDAFPIDILFESESVTGCDFGYTSGSTDYIEISIFRRIYGQKVDIEEMLQTISHELVHAKQLLTGRLSLESDNFTWEGIPHCHENIQTPPWEIEATAVGEVLYRKCI
jgi:hypothetical protein